MIPVELTIQGLYSYQEKQTIDFTQLTAAHLFGIFGAVGSGKSSILEAITYALYGRSARLNLSGDNRYYNMMNLKSDQLFIEFIFEAGKDQILYRSVVSSKRNSKKFDDVKQLERSVYKKKNTQWLPVETSDLEQAIGLSYDNFRRTIIIPQGQFQEFLQLGNKDRTQMLKELFDLGKYEFYYRVASLESKNNAELQTIHGQLMQLEDVNQTQAEWLQQQLGALKLELTGIERNIKLFQQQADAMDKLQELVVKLADTELQQNKLLELEPEYKKLEKNIHAYELCVREFKHLLQSLDECNLRIEKKNTLVKQEEIRLNSLNKLIDTTRKQLDDIKPAYEECENMIQKVNDLDLLVRIRTLRENIHRNQTQIDSLHDLLKHSDDTIKLNIARKSTTDTKLKDLKQKLPDISLLAEVKTWYMEHDRLRMLCDGTDRVLEKWEQDLNLEKERFHQTASELGYSQLIEKEDISKIVLLVNDKNNALREEIQLLQKDADELRVKNQLGAYAEELKEGEPCPLCGSLTHPEIYDVEEIEDAQKLLQEQMNQLSQQILKNDSKCVFLKELEKRLNHYIEQYNDCSRKKDEALKALKDHEATFIWEKYTAQEEVTEELAKVKGYKIRIEEAEKELAELNDQIEKLSVKKGGYESEIEIIQKEDIVHQTRIDMLKEQVKVIALTDYDTTKLADIVSEKNDLIRSYTQLEEKHSHLTRQLEESTGSFHNISGGLDSIRKELVHEYETHKSITEQVDVQLKSYGYYSIEEVRKILTLPIVIETDKKKLADFRQQQAVLANKYKLLKIEIDNREYDAETHQKLKTEIGVLKEQWLQKNQALGGLNRQYETLHANLEKKEKLVKEKEKQEQRAANIKTMKSLFKASGFVNYISSVYLQNLCIAANERFFQLTRQKLSLEITSDNNFQVRDYMNGGKVRSIKTLSGGQTFQAALSLALALADNIQKITDSKQNFFFLDEGFGSLDKESLAVVFDTLKTLRKENRIVGVISHVEEMQQEIESHLQIEHQDENGSIIHPSWMGRTVVKPKAKRVPVEL